MARSRRRAVRLRLVPLAAVPALAATALALDSLGPQDPTAEEQHAIWTLNRARSNPERYGNRIGVDLSAVTPRPPLAVNRNLTGSARFHAKEMLTAKYFGHTSAVTGDGPNQMAVDHGYDLFGQGVRDWGNANTIESNAKGVKLLPKFTDALALLVEDKGVPSLGHRVHLLAIAEQFAAHREVGMGAAKGGDEFLYSIHTAYSGEDDTFLTGVVYDDRNRNGLFDAGEGLPDVTVAAGALQTTSLASGGWSLRVGDGPHDVVCSGGAFRGTGRARVTVAGQNVAIDFRSGVAGAQVDFTDVDLPAVPGPEVAIDPFASSGTSPLTVGFQAVQSGEDAVAWSWNLGDGTASTDVAPERTYGPGAYAVFLAGTDAEGTGRATAVVVTGDGAGPGTAAPADPSLGVTAATLRAKHSATGKDRIAATLAFELPAGFTGTDGLALEVVAAGVKRTFVLDAKGRATDGAGASVRLTWRRPKGGAPTAPGVRAKLLLAWKGDFADALDAAGLRDATEKRALPNPVPFGVLLGGRPYAAGESFRVVSKAGATSVATRMR